MSLLETVSKQEGEGENELVLLGRSTNKTTFNRPPPSPHIPPK